MAKRGCQSPGNVLRTTIVLLAAPCLALRGPLQLQQKMPLRGFTLASPAAPLLVCGFCLAKKALGDEELLAIFVHMRVSAWKQME